MLLLVLEMLHFQIVLKFVMGNFIFNYDLNVFLVKIITKYINTNKLIKIINKKENNACLVVFFVFYQVTYLKEN
jgi:hypothetical protein